METFIKMIIKLKEQLFTFVIFTGDILIQKDRRLKETKVK